METVRLRIFSFPPVVQAMPRGNSLCDAGQLRPGKRIRNPVPRDRVYSIQSHRRIPPRVFQEDDGFHIFPSLVRPKTSSAGTVSAAPFRYSAMRRSDSSAQAFSISRSFSESNVRYILSISSILSIGDSALVCTSIFFRDLGHLGLLVLY